MPSIVVFDGHDGCGKSTLARRAAAQIDGQVVKPFGDRLGDHIAWLWRKSRFDEADKLARASIEREMESADPHRPILFDRHWLSMFTVLPEELWHSWHPLPLTVVCHADTDVVVRRLLERGEDSGDRYEHVRFQQLYLELARLAPASLVIDTTDRSVDDSAREVLEFLTDLGLPASADLSREEGSR
jgi:thymidylate kinase